MFGWTSKTTALPRRLAEVSGAYDSGMTLQSHGMMAGTKVASNLGWRVAEGLAVGDKVLTFDHGMQEIVGIERQTFWLDAPDTEQAQWPVIVPVGALENRVPLTLLADQGVMVESDAAADVFGDPFVIVPAHALVGVRGITRQAPKTPVELIALTFAEEQVVYAEGGALIHCPAKIKTLDSFIDAQSGYDVLSPKDAAFVAECLSVEDEMLASGGMAAVA